jgi:hypothetical protein
MWVIPRHALPAVAARNGWTIDLRGDDVVDTSEAESSAATPMEPVPGHQGDQQVQPSTAPALNGHRPTPASSLPVAQTGSTMTATEPTGSAMTTAEPKGSAMNTAEPTVTEVLDMALLDRLLGAQEDRATAEARLREANHALAALNDTHNRITSELEIERRERLVASDRFREEREARLVADAKVAELRDRMHREVALAEAERQARVEAVRRGTQAETDVVSAVSSMGWLARRRFRRARSTTTPT